MSDFLIENNVITQTGRVRLKRIPGGGYMVESPDGNFLFDFYLPAYFAYLDAIGWTDKP